MRENVLTKQKPVRFIGVFRQVYGGASTWITLAIFIFSAISAWNTATLALLRGIFPWLNLYAFIGILIVGGVITLWLEYKFVQPSVMVYWNSMFYHHGNPMTKDLEELKNGQKRLEELLGEIKGKVK